MPENISATINLPTPYGPAGYEITVAPTGEVLSVTSAAANLPEMVFRLSYAGNWESAREYFLLLSHDIPYQAEVAIWLPDPPAEFKELRRTFRTTFAESISESREEDAPHLRRARFWLANPEAQPALFRQRKLSTGLARLEDIVARQAPPLIELEPWIYAALSFLPKATDREKMYAVLARLDTDTGRDYLFGELARDGRHPYANTFLYALRHFSAPRDRARIIGLYDQLGSDPDLMRRYLQLLHPFSGTEIHAVILRALADHPRKARHVLTALRQTGHPAPESIIRARFDQEENYFLLDLLAELVAAGPESSRVNLADMNEKVATPHFIDGAQVTWPQMLEPNWERLVVKSTAEVLFPQVQRYLLRPEGRLQRNALLQLQRWLRDRPDTLPLPLAIEDRLRELIDSRYDKVSTVALNIIETTIPFLTDQPKMVDALLRHAPVSQYRIMVAAALKRAVKVPGLKLRQIDYFTAAIRNATDIITLRQIERVLPYLTYLGVKEELKIMAKKQHQEIG